MSEWIDKSEFYHFGILPQICIHSLDEDQYSRSYEPLETCDCGCTEWIESTMKIIEDDLFPLKRVHRCKYCNEVRIAHHIGLKEKNERVD